MAYFTATLSFSLHADGEEGAQELLFSTALDEFEDVFEYSFNVADAAADNDKEPEDQFDRFLVTARVVVRADNEAAAGRELEELCGSMTGALQSWYRTRSEPAPCEDPAKLHSATVTLLNESGLLLGLMVEEDIREFERGVAFEDLESLPALLPSGYREQYTVELLRRYVDALESVQLKLCAFPDTELNSTAEELAAYKLLCFAQGQVADELEDIDTMRAELEMLLEDAFEDTDARMLYDGALDGFQDDPALAVLGMTNLNVDDWFLPFRS